ncbi:MAG: DotA/TraY family protein [Alphaproteobacteria bacterium]|nr:DotA/TraY family protein [Alphaproteobacteria bacterium]
MDDSKKSIKVSSVLGFMLMPQFRLSFQHLSFIVPVFMRTIAVMFEQAGLLPQDHPATKYGMEGVKKYEFFELIREVWEKLRASPSTTPYQWSLFIGVLMMIAVIILGAISVVLNVTGMLVGNATAQVLFDNPNGDTSMSGSGFAAPCAGGCGMFNKTQGTGAHLDYGIMILDKMLREGAKGSGGPLQNAFGGLMQIYNSGILVIAAIMVFWAIVTIVVDTARTGQIGGGRHNMVWSPIRIVFALGLMVPLGATSGFSSGQYMVMKLAEWGSNFGTNAWVKYVDTVLTDQSILVAGKAPNMTDLINKYEKMWLCRIAWNGYTEQAMGGMLSNTDQIIETKKETYILDRGTITYQFTNNTASNICGSITFRTENDPIALTHVVGDAVLGDDPVANAIITYRSALIKEYSKLFIIDGNPPSEGVLTHYAKDFACGFVAQHLYGGEGGTPPSPLLAECGNDGGGKCGAGAPGSGKYPDVDTCVRPAVKQAYDDVKAGMDTAYVAFQNSIQNDMLKGLKKEGWAGMGRWYHQISSMNKGVSAMSKPSVTINGGNGGRISLMGMEVKAAQAEKVKEILNQYSKWLQTVPLADLAPTGDVGATVDDSNYKGKAESATGDGEDVDNSYTDSVSDIVLGGMGDQGLFLMDVASPSDPNTYPLAQLAANGDTLVLTGTVMIAALSAIQAVLGVLDASGLGFSLGNLGTTIANSMLFEMLNSIATTIVGAGLLLSVYVPMIPFIRVLFSVLTWMISVFEAVVMVPIAALAHLTTEGEGIAGGARQAWILWLNVLLRPTLTVIGFVGAILVFNTFVLYFHDIFMKLTLANLAKNGFLGLFAIVSNTVIYVGIMYTAANMCFKLLDIIPSAMMKWIGGGQADHSFDNEAVSGMVSAGGQAVSGGMSRGAGSAKGEAHSAQAHQQRRAEEKEKEDRGNMTKA